MTLQETLDAMTFRLYGRRLSDAIAMKRCVKCNRAVGPEYMEGVDRMEWYLSGLCPDCYEDVMGAPEE